jgi:hypothetical protein
VAQGVEPLGPDPPSRRGAQGRRVRRRRPRVLEAMAGPACPRVQRQDAAVQQQRQRAELIQQQQRRSGQLQAQLPGRPREAEARGVRDTGAEP